MNGLLVDFISTDWMAKPWDDPYSSCCGPFGPAPTWLNAQLITVDGIEQLTYDQVPYQLTGNGIIPDIPSLGSHTGSYIPDNSVVHTVWQITNPSHPAITLDGVYISSVLSVLKQPFVVDFKLFSTANDCNNEIYDWWDGYPYSTGVVETTVDSPRIAIIEDTIPTTALFFLGDGVLIGSGVRLDAGTLLAQCGFTDPSYTTLSSINDYLNDDGLYDWNADQLSVQQHLRADESIGIGSMSLDGTIPSLFQLLPSCTGRNLRPLPGDSINCVLDGQLG